MMSIPLPFLELSFNTAWALGGGGNVPCARKNARREDGSEDAEDTDEVEDDGDELLPAPVDRLHVEPMVAASSRELVAVQSRLF